MNAVASPHTPQPMLIVAIAQHVVDACLHDFDDGHRSVVQPTFVEDVGSHAEGAQWEREDDHRRDLPEQAERQHHEADDHYQNQVEPELERNQRLELGFRRRLAASNECLSDAAVGEENSEDPHGRAKGDETKVVRRQKPRSHEGSEEPDEPDAPCRAMRRPRRPSRRDAAPLTCSGDRQSAGDRQWRPLAALPVVLQ